MSLSPTMHTARFGGQAFDCVSTSDRVNQSVAEHTFPRKDGAHLQPMGAGPRRTQLRCIFFEVPPDGDDSGDNYQERYESFYQKINSGKTLSFVHPIFGSYRAKVVGEITTDASSDEFDILTVDCTFVEDSTTISPFDFSASRPVDMGIAGVEVEAAKLEAALESEGLSSPVAGDTVDSVAKWRTDDTITTRRVNLELQSITSKISSAVEEFELATNLQRQPIWRSFQRLQGEVRRAAQLFQQNQPEVFYFTVRTDAPLRVLVVDMYGAADAQRRYEELLTLNDISDPLLILEGTRLKATSPQTQESKGLRSAL